MKHNQYAAVGVLAGAMFFRMFGVFVALPVAALYAASLPDGDKTWAAGVAVGGYGITQALMQMPAGALADRLGRKPVLVSMLLVFAAGGFVAANADNVWQLAAGRLLQGGGAVAAVTAAWISDITAPEHRSRAMLCYGAAIALAFVSSLFAAPFLAGVMELPGIFDFAGWLGIASAIAVSLLPAPPAATKPDGNTTTASAFNKKVLICAAGAFVAHYALSALFLHAPPQFAKELPLEEHWRIYMPSFLLAVPFSLLLIWREKKFSDKFPASSAAMLLVAAGVIPIFIAGELLWQSAGLFLFFAGFVALEAMIPARASRVAPPDKRGRALGMVMSMEFLGMFCGAAVSGAVIDFAGVFVALGVILLLFLMWFVIIMRV